MLTIFRLKEVLTYEPLTGYFIHNLNSKRRSAGSVAGSVRQDGYCRIGIDRTHYYSHRLAWFYVYGGWPKNIDHINGVYNDNRIVNLRECTQSQNIANSKLRRDSVSGFKGVSWSEIKGKWQSRIKVDGLTRRLGEFDNVVDAHQAYIVASQKFFGEFARTK